MKRSTHINVRASAEDKDRLRRVAAYVGLSESELVRDLLRRCDDAATAAGPESPAYRSFVVKVAWTGKPGWRP